jgi:hypothetical protein
MTTLKTISPKQHESLLQQKRQERAMEDRRLDKLKIGLMQKIEAIQHKSANIRVA